MIETTVSPAVTTSSVRVQLRDRREQVSPKPEVPEHALACGRHLHRLAGDGEDQQVADQRAQRAVVVDQPREHTVEPSAMTLLAIIAPARPAALAVSEPLQAVDRRARSAV